ncbi:hypothetical protein P879_11580 [Paragonimus westermani]|uniref:Uncharacterized protein n=1 Tax=Paragonimus westermani TaxID=34504 RepID=A0A8T0D5A1_9TREM|nr:hypothetical protein P879_11580 [Paragonimus westermani]
MRSGVINERQSFEFLLSAGVGCLVESRGLPLVVFRGIHTSTFIRLACGRLRISVGFYVDFFLPNMGTAIEAELGPKRFLIKEMYEKILRILSTTCLPPGCGLRKRLLYMIVLRNPKLFGLTSAHNIHNRIQQIVGGCPS